eukprot:3527402-Prymnesium_polylepis.1
MSDPVPCPCATRPVTTRHTGFPPPTRPPPNAQRRRPEISRSSRLTSHDWQHQSDSTVTASATTATDAAAVTARGHLRFSL